MMGLFGPSKAEIERERDAARGTVFHLQKLIESMGGGDVLRVQALVDDGNRRLAELHAQYESNARFLGTQEAQIRTHEQTICALRAELGEIHGRIDRADDGYYDSVHPAEDSVRLGAELADVRATAKALLAAKGATDATQNFTFNDSTAKGKKFVDDMSKLMLRSYNAEAENCVLTVRAGNLDAALKRLQRAKEQAERLGKMIDLRITAHYHSLRVRELSLASLHLQAKAAEKDAEREERVRLREESRAQREFEAEKAKLRKEEAHYRSLLAALTEQGRAEEAEAARAQLERLGAAIADVDYRAANIRAGYVYVISNFGAFGERVVKIGMTRRLEPMDRVRELGDASVPFNYDVHALFFSEDAVGVEAALHREFADRRVNLVNPRREFFYATPVEVKAALAALTGSLLEFREVPDAEQYRESEQMRSVGDYSATSLADSVENAEDDD